MFTLSHLCGACGLGKAHKLPFPGHLGRTSAVGNIVHSDIVGELEPWFPDRFQYVFTFIGDHWGYTFFQFLRTRDEVNKAFAMMTPKLS